MRFKNETERLAHPQARLIPNILYLKFELFSSQISDFQIDLMKTPWAEVASRVEGLNDYSEDNKLCYWVCIMLSHSSASDEELLHLAHELNLPTFKLFNVAAATGRLNMINQLTAALTPVEISTMIKAGGYLAFSEASFDGYLPVMNRLVELAPTDVLKMIKACGYRAFFIAAQGGYLAIIERLIALAPTEVSNMIKAQDYYAFREAVDGGHLATMEKLVELAPAEMLNMMKAKNYRAFIYAAERGHLAIMEKLIELAPAEMLSMIKSEDYRAFHSAAERGHLAIMDKLMELAPAEKLNMIRAVHYRAFCGAAQGGHLPVIERLIELAPDDKQSMIKASDLRARRFGVEGYYLPSLDRLAEMTPAEQNNMYAGDSYAAFCLAAKNGHLPIIERLMVLAPADIQNMIKAGDYLAFSWAAGNGHLEVMERLMALVPAVVQNMIKGGEYFSFQLAARNGHLSILERLIALAPSDDVLNMIQANDFKVFHEAAEHGHLPILERLIALAPADYVLNMVKANDYKVFREAAEQGHLSIIERLITLADADVSNMVQANNYAAFRKAADKDHLPVINRLLSFSAVIGYAEMHGEEYGRFVRPFITTKLTSIRSQRQALESANPHAVFDITDVDAAKSCFYIIRNLIRRNDPTLLDDLRFLLEIPAVKALAHLEVTAGVPNELVRLALTTGNQAAAEILLAIPAVRELAERNDYYRDEVNGGLDLGVLARDRESSMHMLTTGEQQRIAAATARYQPIMQEAGVGHLFDHLLAELRNRYSLHPSTITIDGVIKALPADWEAFTHLELTNLQRQEALKAYYQHKDHTALRYLSCPNHWMAPDASYVYINPEHTQRWSTFEEFKPFIVMLWLAAQDVTIAPTDGHTLEGRITHFIDELALIGRAHNWDHSRNRVDSSGHAIEEEFDDLTGDKPSCFSGVRRRLFQSVIGHPLLKILTEADIKQELRDFVRAHFTRLITDENRDALQAAWTKYCVDLELADAAPLRMLDITTEQQALFIQELTAKYGLQFSGDVKFRNTITTAFTLVEKESNPSDCMHALKFDGLVNLKQLLQSPTAAAGAGASAIAIGFFSGAAVVEVGAGVAPADKPVAGSLQTNI